MRVGRVAKLVSRISYHASRNQMKILLAVAAACEAALGLILLVYPPIVIRLLLGAEIIGVGDVVSRFAGIALISLGVACWPNGSARQALDGMLTYGTLAALYLAYVGVRGQGVGVLLWPAVVRELETRIFGAAVQILPHSCMWSGMDSSSVAAGQTVSIIS